MIKKWKKLINNEKTNKNNPEDHIKIEEERNNSKPKRISRDKSAKNRHREDSDNEYSQDAKFKNSVISYKTDLGGRTNKLKNSLGNNKHNLSNSSSKNKSFTQSLNKKIEDKLNNSSQKNYKDRDSLSKSKDKKLNNKKSDKDKSLSPLKNNMNIYAKNNSEKPSDLESLNTDKILKILYKLYNSLPKSNLDNFDIKNFSDDLNDVINLYIKKLNYIKEAKHANEQKEIILQTKCNTAERMIKEYEVKYLTAEKEKVIFLLIKIIYLL